VSETKHTPGPWYTKRAEIRVDGEYDYAIYDANKEVVAEAFGRTSVTNFPPAEANAHLIASAPDLYAALKFVLAFYEPDAKDYLDTEAWKRAEAQARAALKKARGE
jgi:hypothetical protein